jgi:hypothetical protein
MRIELWCKQAFKPHLSQFNRILREISLNFNRDDLSLRKKSSGNGE